MEQEKATMTNPAVTVDPFASVTSMLAALQAGQVSATELLEQHLRRIERYNPQINAIVIPNYEQARRRAAEADAAHARGESLGPLHGLPLTIKDCIEVAGLRTTAGVVQRANAVSTQNGPVAQRVLDAGAVLIGKTNVPPYAGDWQANNEVFGRTNNPWDLERTPGGSTGGGAAALAAGLTPLEFGSDIGGSIRIPAAFCGVYGHRPSDSAVPRYGHIPGSPLPNPAVIMGVQGPLARSAADLELALNVIAGPVVGEDVAWKLALPAARHSVLSHFRVAIMPQAPWLPVDAEITAAVEDLATRLGKLGATVAVTQPEGFDWQKYQQTYTTLLNVFMFAELKDEERAGIAKGLRHSSDLFVEAQLLGVTATAPRFLGLLGRREHYRATWRDFFRDWDVLLTPATITSAFQHIGPEIRFPDRTLTINGDMVPYGRMQVYAGLATLSGQPATAFPWGLTRQGLPIGLQAIGPYLEDFTTIAFASLLEREFGGFVAPPGYDEL